MDVLYRYFHGETVEELVEEFGSDVESIQKVADLAVVILDKLEISMREETKKPLRMRLWLWWSNFRPLRRLKRWLFSFCQKHIPLRRVMWFWKLKVRKPRIRSSYWIDEEEAACITFTNGCDIIVWHRSNETDSPWDYIAGIKGLWHAWGSRIQEDADFINLIQTEMGRYPRP